MEPACRQAGMRWGLADAQALILAGLAQIYSHVYVVDIQFGFALWRRSLSILEREKEGEVERGCSREFWRG